MWTTSRVILGAYTLAQLTVGVQLGVAAAWLVLQRDWPLTYTLALAPLGLPMVFLQYVLALRFLGRTSEPG